MEDPTGLNSKNSECAIFSSPQRGKNTELMNKLTGDLLFPIKILSKK